MGTIWLTSMRVLSSSEPAWTGALKQMYFPIAWYVVSLSVDVDVLFMMYTKFD